VPAFLAGEEAKAYVCVYPFVRSYEWYLLPDEERREMLAEHGQQARGYPDVRANTVASFALGDYEWILAFEADELHRIVDLMRDLRASRARRHVREEIPFYTGRRRPGRRDRGRPALTRASGDRAIRSARRSDRATPTVRSSVSVNVAACSNAGGVWRQAVRRGVRPQQRPPGRRIVLQDRTAAWSGTPRRGWPRSPRRPRWTSARR
jgi:hypothetical protein